MINFDFSNIMELTWSHDWLAIIILTIVALLGSVLFVAVVYGVIKGIVDHIRQRRREKRILEFYEQYKDL